MSILISGSVAFDTIIQTIGNFENFSASTSHLHLSLFSPSIRKEYGGTAANIAYSLALLGKKTDIIASVGEDARDYLLRMNEMSIRTELIQTVPGSYSPQAYIIRDEWSGQINTFHPGAMSMSWELTHGNIDFSYAIVSPDSKEGMIRRVTECTNAWIFTIFDPGQAMGIFSKNELIDMVVKSNITIMNEPEKEQFMNITGEDVIMLCKSYGRTAIITLGEKWSRLDSTELSVTIPPLYTENIVDATGCGDAYRSGLLYGLSEWWDIVTSCTLGSILGGIKIGYMGGQNHSLDKNTINEIGRKQFAKEFFD
jgi:adenosine kinase